MIPIVINNYNRLKTTEELCWQLWKLGYNSDIHILDNGSDYKPLLSWYKALNIFIPGKIKVHHLEANVGPLAFYSKPIWDQFTEYEWVAYSDSDIKLNENTPRNFLELMREAAEKHSVNKVGLALKIEDLPENQYAQHYKNWEKRFWMNELEPNVYKADVDTTFCLIKPNRPFGYEAIRMAGDFTAEHVPWYTDFGNMSEEEKNYLDTSNDTSTYKRFYNNYIQEHE